MDAKREPAGSDQGGDGKDEGDKAKGAKPELRPLGWTRFTAVRVVG